MLNPDLNINVLSQAYAQNRLIVIRNILLGEVALELQQALEGLDWFLEIKDRNEANILRIPLADVKTPDSLLAVLDNSEHPLDRNQLFFMRLCANVGEFNNKYLGDFADYLNTEEFLAPIRKIVGKPEVRHVWVEATRYDRCCFLGTHRDDHHPDNLVAFVLNLTQTWRIDWGGLLMYMKSEKTPPIILPPIWNSLSLFDVPVDHLVSSVSPAATGSRLSLTGWLRP